MCDDIGLRKRSEERGGEVGDLEGGRGGGEATCCSVAMQSSADA